MNWVKLFLSPNGRTPARPFWTGVAILAPINVALGVAAYFAPPQPQALVGLVGWLTVFPWLCVCAKRLHDANRTAAWVLAPVGVAFLVGMVVGLTVMMPVLADTMQAAMDNPHAPPPGPEAYGPGTAAYAAGRQAALITLPAGWLIYGLFLLWTGRARHDPETNRFGPPEDATAA